MTNYTAQGVHDKIVRVLEDSRRDEQFRERQILSRTWGLKGDRPLIDISSMSSRAWEWFLDSDREPYFMPYDAGPDDPLEENCRQPFLDYFLLSSQALYCIDSDKAYIDAVIPPSRDRCGQASHWNNFIINIGSWEGHDRDGYVTEDDLMKGPNGQVLAELLYFLYAFNQVPDITYVSAEPAKKKRYKKALRYHQRERILCLSQKQVRRIYPHFQGKGEGGQKAPHFRRGYFRNYTNECFSQERRAKRQWIGAHWVGDREAVHRDVRYKVRLDL